jgi:hypothetical protein
VRMLLAEIFFSQRYLIRSISMSILLALLFFDVAAASNESGIIGRYMNEELVTISPNDFDNDLNYSYEKIDNYAINAPPSAEASIQSLAAYLVKPWKNEREKARSIFRWIAENIDYNVEGLFTGNYGNMNSKDLLKSRKSVCDGYSDIFQSLATEAGLESARVSGWGKGYGYQPGKKFNDSSNHAWNAVKINGSWYLIDCTWGAGYINEDKKYVRKFDDHYFMTPPSEFIFDHFPDNSSWQLLNNPFSKSEFEQRVYVKSEFFRYDLKIGSHLDGNIKTDKEMNISVFAPKDVLLIADLKYSDKNQPFERTNLDDYVFCERDGNRYDIYVQFPSNRGYTLRVYAKGKEEPGEYLGAIEYGIEAMVGRKECVGYPMTYSTFTDTKSYLYRPMEGKLKSGTSYRFKIKVPNANNVSVICGTEWSYLKSERGIFEGNVTPVKGDVLVCANFEGDRWDGLLKYTAD